MRKTARQTRENRTITVDFHDERTYCKLLDDRKAFVEFVLAFLLALGVQLKHKATCGGGRRLTRHSHYMRVRVGIADEASHILLLCCRLVLSSCGALHEFLRG
jgi:hypothetical protein